MRWCVGAADSVETHREADGFNPDGQSDRVSLRILDSRKNYRQQSQEHIVDTLVLFVEWYDRWWKWMQHKYPDRTEFTLWDPIAYESYTFALDLIFDLGVERPLPLFIARPSRERSHLSVGDRSLKTRRHVSPGREERLREGDRRSHRYRR